MAATSPAGRLQNAVRASVQEALVELGKGKGKGKGNKGTNVGFIPIGKGEYLDPAKIYVAPAGDQEITPGRVEGLAERGNVQAFAPSAAGATWRSR